MRPYFVLQVRNYLQRVKLQLGLMHAMRTHARQSMQVSEAAAPLPHAATPLAASAADQLAASVDR
jgi:hypothetical protein